MSSFKEYYGRCLDFKGRTSKDALWAIIIVVGLVNILAVGGLMAATGSNSAAVGAISYLLAIPSLALTVRRLHDTNRSGWCVLWFFTVIGMAPLLWWCLVLEGTQGPNRFGPDPLGRAPRNTSQRADKDAGLAHMDELKKLGELREKGVLTEEEFVTRKERLLAGI